MFDQSLVASSVVEEERRDRAPPWVAAVEVSVYEGGRRAVRIRRGYRVAMRVVRSLHGCGRKWNDEVAVHAPHQPAVHRSRTERTGLTRTRAAAYVRYETSVLELLDHGERAVLVRLDGEVPVERVGRPVVSTG